jgi:uncharacterized protein YyaL (SSP411 family)
LLVAVIAVRTQAESASQGVAWRSSLKVALQEAKRLKKPVMVELGAKWCGPCHTMDKRTYTDARVIRESRWWVPVKVDIDAQPEIAARYGLKMPPLVVFLKPDGSVAGKFAGYADAASLVKQMKVAYARARKQRVAR